MPAGSKVWTMASTRSTSASGTPSALGDVERAGEEIAGLVDLLDDLLGDDQVGAGQDLAGLAAEMVVRATDLLAGEAVEIGALAAPPPPPVPIAVHAEAAHRIGGAVLVEILAVVVDVERALAAGRVGLGRSASRLAGVGRPARARAPRPPARPRRPPVSSSGFFSSSSAMKLSTSRLDSASSLIACWSCGVITSDWDWRRSRRGPSAMIYSSKLSPR